jgi:ABC-type polysaccharide/polyol phosphate transport system ATPase subunit
VTAAIELRNVTKEYRKYSDRTAGGLLGRFRTSTSTSTFTALRDIDLTVHPGDSLGVIGRNGAGKSTLLQLLCGVTAPTSGVVEVRGRVAPLISVGVGFHPEMTGRENVHVNGTILGMSRREVDTKFDDIVAFAELESFIDTPVKFYSSGMFVRLGFAVAVEARPDVLLVDEVLAVGDFAFQLRCFERMNEIRASGTTVVVVTHNMNAVRGFCDRAVVLDQGRVVHDGTTYDGIAAYFDLVSRSERDESTAGSVEIETFELRDEQDRATSHVQYGETLSLRLAVRAVTDIEHPFQSLDIESGSGVTTYSDARFDHVQPALRAGDRAVYEARLVARLPTGNYTAGSALHDLVETGRPRLLATAPRLSFYVSGRDTVHGAADLGAEFVVRDRVQ